MQKVTIITIAGGSASGKTTVAQAIANQIFKNEPICHISMDNYYKDFSNLSFEERQNLNFDHPNSLDIDRLCKDLDDLKENKSIDVPQYDFKTHSQSGNFTTLEPSNIVILDGILSLHIEEIRKRSDIKIFIKTDDDVRFIRRLLRDVNERGRQLNDVIAQYLETVKPMHKYFVVPSIDYADVIIPYYEGNTIAIDLIASKIKNLLKINSTTNLNVAINK
ncbi:uridine kinase [Spiroplasma taiwanense]|uniref:Uridine kinase n=1 Tax=Spiroplasma taiwanense CT-1 TaxID=1276220 RepID=S5MGY7_9MOLU|nr:uridine kinase [Spiroplasma taiwanense]AGR41115.1 uridine kinase [Spiroplasma taiwanense CT-1]